MTNPWHDVSYGDDAPDVIRAIIEVPKDSKLKYELDKESGLLKLDRALYSAVYYPGDYGFIPQTYWEDGDPMDILVISNIPVHPLTIVTVRPIGVLEMQDEKDRDDKIIAVYSTDPRFSDIKTLSDLPEHIILEIEHFFKTYKELQNKKVKILSRKEVDDAREFIKEAIDMYEHHFLGKKKKK